MKAKTFTVSEAHRYFAVDFHSRTWELLGKPDRTRDDDERMVDYAHSSLAHWRTAGTAVHHHRGEWLLARVFAVLGESQLAIRHAHRCNEILQANPGEMEDFDFAFAFEALARAHAVAGEREEAERFLQKASEMGEKIAESEDREVFFASLRGGPWNGVHIP